MNAAFFIGRNTTNNGWREGDNRRRICHGFDDDDDTWKNFAAFELNSAYY